MNRNSAIYYPHDEVNTFLIPVTKGCQYNNCIFCSMYIDEEFSEISFEEIENQLLNGYLYTERVFLTGADPMAIGFKKMEKLLDLIQKHLPYCACVASYASIRAIAKYSVDELSILHNKGLRSLYIGFETGRDDVLKLMKKGHTVAVSIAQAKKLNEAHLQFNTIIMYGIGGRGESIDNAIATAKMINEFQTNKVITMNLKVFQRSRLEKMVEKGLFIPSSRTEKLMEIRTILENLNPKEEMVFDTTHPTNIAKIKGKLPQDRNRLLKELEKWC